MALARGPWRRELGSKPEMDPLSESDALLEAQVLDVHVDALRASVAVLLEMRLALQLREGNTALLVARQVTDFVWRAERRATARTAWNVVGSEASVSGKSLELRIGLLPWGEMFLRAGSAAFYIGDVPGLVEIPDYGLASESELNLMIAHWDSEFVPLRAVFLESAE
jgi:hypothetical protein